MKKVLAILVMVFITIGGITLGLSKHKTTPNTTQMENGKLYRVYQLSTNESGLQSLQIEVGDNKINIDPNKVEVDESNLNIEKIGTLMASVSSNGKIHLEKYVDGVPSDKYLASLK